MEFLAVGLGGFIGASLRYAMSIIPFFSLINFPVATLAINFLGAFLIGLITVTTLHFESIQPYAILFMKTGLCGGFTTFSTFSLEIMDLLANGRIFTGIFYATLSVVICVFAIYISRLVFQVIFL
ncbi:MAG: fluoride efflux transporter CrcB [Synergistaceae bacterium]